jgi:hypothetical protein
VTGDSSSNNAICSVPEVRSFSICALVMAVM